MASPDDAGGDLIQQLDALITRLREFGIPLAVTDAMTPAEKLHRLGQSVIAELTEHHAQANATEIAAQRQLFQAIVENAPEGIAILEGPEHRYVLINPAYRPFVAGKGDILGRTVAEVFPEITDTVVPLLDRVYHTGELYSAVDMPLTLFRDGKSEDTFITFNYASWRDELGQIRGILVLVHETTERKRTEEALRQLTESLEQRVNERTAQLTKALEREQTARGEAESARAYFQGLLEAAPDSIVIANADGRITLVNTQTEQMTGYTRAELIGQPAEILIPERFHVIHLRYCADYMSNPRTRTMGVGLELFLMRKDGGEIPVEISLSPFQTPTGLLVTAIIRDISARKFAEAEITRLNSELQRHVTQLQTANKELEAFSYSVSHDMRAPLRGIDGFSRILSEQYPDNLDARGRDYLARIRAAAQRMGHLIEDMLGLSRVGRVEMRLSAVNLSALAADIVAELRERDPERQVEIVIREEMLATGDAALLRIGLDNLLGNAWKFTGRRADARIEFGQEMRDGECVYFVRDNGAGYDMAYANKLFAPFQRLHTETEFPGTGIGLAIVSRIISRHGGRVWAEGKEDEGATFYFTLAEEQG